MTWLQTFTGQGVGSRKEGGIFGWIGEDISANGTIETSGDRVYGRLGT